MWQGHAPTAGHDTGHAGKEEAGKALPDLVLGFSLLAGEWGHMPKLDMSQPLWEIMSVSGPALAVRIVQGHGLGNSQDLGSCSCDCMRPLHVGESVFPKTWNTWIIAQVQYCSLYTGGPRASCSTVCFTHLQHITLPKQRIMSYKASYCDCKDSRTVTVSPHPFSWHPSQQ